MLCRFLRGRWRFFLRRAVPLRFRRSFLFRRGRLILRVDLRRGRLVLLPLPRVPDRNFPGFPVFLKRRGLIFRRKPGQFIRGRNVYAVGFQFLHERRAKIPGDRVEPPDLRRAGVQGLCNQLPHISRQFLFLLDSLQKRAGSAGFLDLVPRRFFPLGVCGNQHDFFPDCLNLRVLFVCFDGTRHKFKFRFALFHKGNAGGAAAVSRNDLVFPAAQRNDDEVLKHFPGKFDLAFQFFNVIHGIEVIFRRHKVKDAQPLNLRRAAGGGCLPSAAGRGPL